SLLSRIQGGEIRSQFPVGRGPRFINRGVGREAEREVVDRPFLEVQQAVNVLIAGSGNGGDSGHRCSRGAKAAPMTTLRNGTGTRLMEGFHEMPQIPDIFVSLQAVFESP